MDRFRVMIFGLVGEARGELFENLMVVGRSSDEEVEGKQVLLIHWDKSTVRDKGWMVVFARRAVSKQWQHQDFPPIFTTRGWRVSRVLFMVGFTVLREVAVPYHQETKQQSIFVGAKRRSTGSGQDPSGGNRKQSRFPMGAGGEERVEEGNADEQQSQ